MSAPSFFSPIPESPRDDLLDSYLQFLEKRNGTVDPGRDYPKREAWLNEANSAPVRYDGVIDQQTFDRSWTVFEKEAAESPALVNLLAFVKMNAGEAYGVEVLTKARHSRPVTSNRFDQVERVLGREETYHTRILAGATRQFNVSAPKDPFQPPMSLRLVIGALVHCPKTLFHPVLLSAEIGGIFIINWMLNQVKRLFVDQPAVRTSLEHRLMEILIDEVGHVAFNRMAVGPKGLGFARTMAPQVAHGTGGSSPEFKVLGWSKDTLRDFEGFDLASLPEEVRRQAFFV
jgi:hypothetical protein